LLLVAGLLNNRQIRPVDIEGHTDSIGSPKYNLRLSRQRAESVKRFFIEEGVYGAEDFRVQTLGKPRPIAPNTNPDGSDNPEGRAKNRRVTVVAVWNF
jgi:OmpA-OmpF porin, OOP family